MADLNTGDTGVPIWVFPSYVQESFTVVAPGSVLVTVPTTIIYQVGLSLLCDAGTVNYETVAVTAVNSSTTFTATFTRPHGSTGLWTITGGLIPSSATVGVAFKGRATGTRYPSAANTYLAATSQSSGVYALYTTSGTDLVQTADTYDIALNTQGTGYNLSSVSQSGSIVVQARL